MNPNATDIIRKLSREITPAPSSCDPVLPCLPDIRSVVFDVYGTLFAPSCGDPGRGRGPGHEPTLLSILDDLGIPVPPGDHSLVDQLLDLVRREHASSRDQGIDYPEIEIRDLWSELLDHPRDSRLEQVALTYECATNPVWPMPGVSGVLASLRARSLALGIVSNAQFYTPLLFPALLGRNLTELSFEDDLCLFSYQHGMAKPGLALYEILRERLANRGLTPEQTLYLGNDALKDIHPAAELGFRTALFAGDNRSLRLHPDKPGLHSPDAVVTTLAQLPELLTPA